MFMRKKFREKTKLKYCTAWIARKINWQDMENKRIYGIWYIQHIVKLPKWLHLIKPPEQNFTCKQQKTSVTETAKLSIS